MGVTAHLWYPGRLVKNLCDMCLYYKGFKVSEPYIFVFKQFSARPVECSDVG